jgi:hypothetical protein
MTIARRLASLAFLALLTSGAAVTGCGVSAATLCDDICSCKTCSDGEHDSCVKQAESAQTAADNAGCSSEFSEVLSCSHDNFACVGGSEKSCSAVLDALEKCAQKK